MASQVSRVSEAVKPVQNLIDREKICPLLLRVFCNNNRHHRPEEFNRGTTPANELQIYTWLDATLKELSNLVKEVNPEARQRGTYFDFASVYPSPRGLGYRLKEIGMTCSGRKGPDDNVSLASKNYQIGDYLDIAITFPPRNNDRMGDMGGRRDNWRM